ncbi:uncharacterized protein G2W53_029129 [Senna tora]|uniref:Uncharacterized protein n=1 Tax=Senna tora TaxID=362788 RepID=A0A834T548_9FABA|nr:uncharacterized protein G2W53_029129 [Senna tora]
MGTNQTHIRLKVVQIQLLVGNKMDNFLFQAHVEVALKKRKRLFERENGF